jgi:hydrogenase maturation protein HypF
VTPRQRVRIALEGAVQGVGFRPFVYRLACERGLAGFVGNSGDGVLIEAEGSEPALAEFLDRLARDLPAHAVVTRRRVTPLPPQGAAGFALAPSAASGGTCSVVVMADLAPCPACLAEMDDPADRRFRYPFITCTQCGPRYSVIESLPYDRERTTLRRFPLCVACAGEYTDPGSRRFHAESICCPECGPQLALWDPAGRVLARRAAALARAAEAIRGGRILALKGLGGFQLLVDARDEAAVRRLRARKRRPRKPLALMVPDIAAAAALAAISATERDALCSPAAPIVLLRALPAASAALAPSVAPGSLCLGLMLPTSPLHRLLTRALGFPVVATSGNLGEAPIIGEESEALARLADVADAFLVHDRPIARTVDDSVVRVIAGAPTVLRRARGYAPLPLPFPATTTTILALGGHQKNAVAIGSSGQIMLGPHGGDLDREETRTAFARSAERLLALHGLRARAVACDRHPDYASTRHAERLGLPLLRVPHHLAHALSGMVDHGLGGPVLAVAWDGTGYGGDGTIWGGEFLAVAPPRYRRVAHLLPFRLPGGEAAVREPRRAALGVLHILHGAAAVDLMDRFAPAGGFSARERHVLGAMLARGINAPLTSSAGRLFDAVASLLGLCQRSGFEGEAAMALEAAADMAEADAPLPDAVLRTGTDPLVVDWRPILAALLTGCERGVSPAALAAGFHSALANAIAAVARQLGAEKVLLTGGCFQNARLTELAVARLGAIGVEAFCHRRVPPNDGGLAVGQIAFAAYATIEERR